ncbi:MAG TPA: DUF5666 domain-containing protein [Pseudolabrys sp.]|nr:DUF5666 domain-containing protein [Pseudolabrys sp.]
MHRLDLTHTLAAAALAWGIAVTAAAAQQPADRIAGTVESFDGHVLAVKSEQLGEVKISLADNTMLLGVAKATVADIKANDYIGVGALPQADGSQRAIQIIIFTEQQRGVGEGHYPWQAHPNNTMTNGAVDETVASVDGPVLMVKYKGGQQKIVVPPETVIRAYGVGDKSELKPGARVAVLRVVKKPDGSFEASRVNIGRGDVVP